MTGRVGSLSHVCGDGAGLCCGTQRMEVTWLPMGTVISRPGSPRPAAQRQFCRVRRGRAQALGWVDGSSFFPFWEVGEGASKSDPAAAAQCLPGGSKRLLHLHAIGQSRSHRSPASQGPLSSQRVLSEWPDCEKGAKSGEQ